MTQEILHKNTLHPYPFGMMMPERNWSAGSGHRFGFGGQEQDNEVAGIGNSYTAMFWQYDSRIGKRWNLDPIFVESISGYSVFSNNPLYFQDVHGDFRTWFGAKLFALSHGGGEVGKFGDEHSLSGQWYVGKEMDVYKSGVSRRINENEIDLATVVVGYEQTVNWKSQSAKEIGDIMFGITNAKFLARILRYSPVLPNGTPNLFIGAEAVYIDGGITTAMEIDAGFIFILAGNNIGEIVPYKEIAGGLVTEIGIGLEIGRIDYFGKAKDFTKEKAMGERTKAWGGVSGGIPSAGLGVALSDKNGANRTMSIGIQLNVGIASPIVSGGVNRGSILEIDEQMPEKY